MTKSRTLPHSLYRKLNDEIKRRERRVLELEATLQRITVTNAEHCKQLQNVQNELAITLEYLDAAEAQIKSLLEEHAIRDAVDEERRKDYHEVQSTAGYYAELNDHLKTRLYTAYTTLAVIGAVAAFTAVISAVHYLPKVL